MNSNNKNFNKNNIFDIKSKYILMQIFNHLKQKKLFSVIKYNKNIQNKLEINTKDFLDIEIELIPKENIYDKFIHIKYSDEYYHIYFNDDKK